MIGIPTGPRNNEMKRKRKIADMTGRETLAFPVRHGCRPLRGFTLIELLVVILIMGILLALGAGGAIYMLNGANRNKTITTQKLIIEAIAAFVDETGAEPVVSDNPDEATAELLEKLWSSAAARETLQDLPDGAVKTNDSNKKSFFDAYGTEMQYFRQGGLGGRPRLVSAGPDEDMAAADDNIFSDEN